MPSMFYESALTFAVLAGVALHVAVRQERGRVHWLVLGLLASMLAWTGGLAGFFLFETGDLAGFCFTVAFFGIFTVPPCWLLLAARQTHLRLFDEYPGWLLAVLVPSAMSLLAVVTNSGHRLFLRDFQRTALVGPPNEWAGPLFWTGLAWGILLLVLGIALYLGAAWRMITNGDVRRGLTLAAIVALPPLASPIVGSVLQRDFTPSLLGLSVLLLFVFNLRHRVLETLPIARRDVIEHLLDGVVLTDGQGVILDANPAAERLIGAPVADLRQRPLALVICDLAAEEDRRVLSEALARLVGEGRATLREFRTRDDRRVEIDAACVRGGDGEASGHYALLRNRSEQRRHELVLRQSQRLETVAALSAGIAHEINDPLAFVRSNLSHIQRLAGLLQEDLRLADAEKREEIAELRQVADESCEGLERIAATLERMRRFSRLQDDEIGEVDVNAVVQDAVKLARARTGCDQPTDLDLAPGLRRVQGSAEHLVQAVLNIVVNARQALAGRRDGWLRVHTRRQGEGVEICIADNGPGIPEEIQERMFDPFACRKGPGAGSGLGLAIAFGIVREHHGVLDLDSQEGRGSEFTIRLPAAGTPARLGDGVRRSG